MRQTINQFAFIDAFRSMGRESQFSYEARQALFEYFEDCDPDMELDVIAICCEYQESSIDEIIEQYSIDVSDTDPDDYADTVQEYLEENAGFCALTPFGFVFAQF